MTDIERLEYTAQSQQLTVKIPATSIFCEIEEWPAGLSFAQKLRISCETRGIKYSEQEFQDVLSKHPSPHTPE